MLESAEAGNRLGKEEYREVVPELRVGLVNAQYDLRNADFPVVVIVAGDDRVAGNELVNRLNEWMDARYLRTFVFRDMDEAERERPRFWRLWRSLPPKGQIAIWAGGLFRMVSAYLAGEVDETAFESWLRHLERMQAALIADGALVIKFFLHTPIAEQKSRLKKAEKDPTLGWRVDQRDWAAVETMPKARPVVESVLRRLSAPGSPWTVVESTDPRYRDVTVARTVLSALTSRLEHGSTPGVAISPELFAPGQDQVTVLSRVDLSKRMDKDDYRKRLNKLQARLHELSAEARERGLSTVLAFEGWDAAGKGGVIRRITQSLEAGDYRVIPIAAPNEEERRYFHLWRFWRDLPPAGEFTIFDRTWYGRVLVERVEGFADVAAWQRGYDEIVDFEEQLVERGYLVQKFWLHISPEEQLARFQARESTPFKQHKITEEDYRNREKWSAYEQAVDQMILRTSSDSAPWYVIASNDKWSARIEVLEKVTQGLKRALRRLPS
ncbi:MAG: polyphosphate:AMP phosphotransferase [Candidatus Nanopelagicales bacterium]